MRHLKVHFHHPLRFLEVVEERFRTLVVCFEALLKRITVGMCRSSKCYLKAALVGLINALYKGA